MTPEERKAEELRVRYLTEAIQTASPASLLVMLYDALEMDLVRADKAFADGRDLKAISDPLIHAQEIILTLRDTLDTNVWDAAPRLYALYDYLQVELVWANVEKDRARAAAVAEHVRQLAGAWREAAARVDAPAVSTTS